MNEKIPGHVPSLLEQRLDFGSKTNMMFVLPKWYQKVEDELEYQIYKLADELNLNQKLVSDSAKIKGAISNICSAFIAISANAKPEYGKKELTDIKILKNLEERNGKRKANK